jgi:hypothetical protein
MHRLGHPLDNQLSWFVLRTGKLFFFSCCNIHDLTRCIEHTNAVLLWGNIVTGNNGFPLLAFLFIEGHQRTDGVLFDDVLDFADLFRHYFV